ncbi:MAG: CoA ester lyase [Methylobacteriaceae bacterium]|jgi:citrate lyase subunit beta/citryl-CoA lyase|nr:CoA ester lyase [Methylobacteriaceae bacterium]
MSDYPCRSALYMPASNLRALAKAPTLDTDAVILDLEDAVAVDIKELARNQAAAAIRDGDFGFRRRIVRINGLESPWAEADLAAFAGSFPDAFLIPKTSEAATVLTVARRLDALGAPAGVEIWAMIETPPALLALDTIASLALNSQSRLTTLVIGTNDLAKATGMRFTRQREPILPWLAIAVMTARARGLRILDGVFNKIQDKDGFEAECIQGRDYGFDGKTLIHPSQLEPANRIFAPSPEEIFEAEEIVALFELPENASKNVVAKGGAMVERLHYEEALKTLALARAMKRESA